MIHGHIKFDSKKTPDWQDTKLCAPSKTDDSISTTEPVLFVAKTANLSLFQSMWAYPDSRPAYA